LQRFAKGKALLKKQMEDTFGEYLIKLN